MSDQGNESNRPASSAMDVDDTATATAPVAAAEEPAIVIPANIQERIRTLQTQLTDGTHDAEVLAEEFGGYLYTLDDGMAKIVHRQVLEQVVRAMEADGEFIRGFEDVYKSFDEVADQFDMLQLQKLRTSYGKALANMSVEALQQDVQSRWPSSEDLLKSRDRRYWVVARAICLRVSLDDFRRLVDHFVPECRQDKRTRYGGTTRVLTRDELLEIRAEIADTRRKHVRAAAEATKLKQQKVATSIEPGPSHSSRVERPESGASSRGHRKLPDKITKDFNLHELYWVIVTPENIARITTPRAMFNNDSVDICLQLAPPAFPEGSHVNLLSHFGQRLTGERGIEVKHTSQLPWDAHFICIPVIGNGGREGAINHWWSVAIIRVEDLVKTKDKSVFVLYFDSLNGRPKPLLGQRGRSRDVECDEGIFQG